MIKSDENSVQIYGRKIDIMNDLIEIIDMVKDDMSIAEIKLAILIGLATDEYKEKVLSPKIKVLTKEEFDEFVSEELKKIKD